MRSRFRLGVLVCTILVSLPSVEVMAETGRSQNFSGRNWFEELFNLNRQPSERVWQQRPSAVPQAERQRPRAPVVAQPRREDNVDPDGEPTATAAPDITAYVPTTLVPLRDKSIAASGITDPVSAAILSELTDSATPAIEVTPDIRTAIVSYYKNRDFIPAWVNVQGLNARAFSMLDVMAKADEEGLNAADYLPASLRSFKDDGGAAAKDPKALARLDLELTAAMLKYAAHARSGRVEPNKITHFNDLKPPVLPAAEVLAAVNAEREPGRYLANLHPTNPYYQAFKAELQALRSRNLTASTMPAIGPGPTLKPGMRDPRVPLLRKRLAALGLLTDDNVEIAGASDSRTNPSDGNRGLMISGALAGSIDPDPSEVGGQRKPTTTGSITVASTEPVSSPVTADLSVYDATVAAAVKQFQKGAGLPPDGVLGRQTLAAFNNENDTVKIDRLVMNMERARWLPRELGDRYIIVNQAAFELSLMDNGKETHRARVVIGTPVNQTPAFSNVMKTIEFNPYWYVPRSIAANEMLPKSRRSPGYLSGSGYEVVNARGQVVHSSSVDWSRYSGRTLPVSVRQPPGKSNALGEVKFLFPNSHAVYLHDTPSKSLFSRDRRAFSHGCIRVHEPRKLAEAILGRDGWNAQRIADAIATNRNNGVTLKHRLDVHLAYFTAWPDANGQMRYLDDVYGRDAKLSVAMSGKRATF